MDRPAETPRPDDLAETLDAADRELLGSLARRIERRRIGPLALFLLEAHRPLEFFAGQMVVFSAPLLGCFLPRGSVDRLAGLLSRRMAIEHLIARLRKDNQDDRPANRPPAARPPE